MARLALVTSFVAILWLALANPASPATFSDTHSFDWTPGASLFGVIAEEDEVPAQFFTDLAGAFTGSSFYLDDSPVIREVCTNPQDALDCYPLFGGPSEIAVGFEITLGGQTFDSTAFGPEAFLAVIPDGSWLFDPETGSAPPIDIDVVSVASMVVRLGSGPTYGQNGRFEITSVSIFALLDADTLADPFGTSIVGLNLYGFGSNREIIFSVFDHDTGRTDIAIARNPEPTASLLLGLGLMALSSQSRLRGRKLRSPTDGNPS